MRSVIVIGFCPAEGSNAGVGGFDWAPNNEMGQVWARSRLHMESNRTDWEHSFYLAIVNVPDGLGREETTSFIDARLHILEPGFLEANE